MDVLIKGGLVINGTGSNGRRADVAITGNIITAVDVDIDTEAENVIDATGLVVSPGFIDSHTHLDAQLFWDGLATPASWHGSTSVIIGNCALGLAPSKDGDPDYGISVMAGVEQIPREILQANVPFGWSTFGQYLDALEKSGLSVDVSALVPYALLRQAAMGDRAFSAEAANEEEAAALLAMLNSALDAGALGLSFNRGLVDRDDVGRPVAGVEAPWSELQQAAELLAQRGNRIMAGLTGWTLRNNKEENEAELEQWISLCRTADAPFAYNPFNDGNLDFELACIDKAEKVGVELIGLAYPTSVGGIISFGEKNMFAQMPAWAFLFDLDPAERLKAMADPEVRKRLCQATDREKVASEGAEKKDEAGHDFTVSWDQIQPLGAAPDVIALDRMSVGAEARAKGVHPVSVLLDQVCAGGIGFSYFLLAFAAFDPKLQMRAISHPRVLVSGNDTGAHLQLACQTASTLLLGNFVRRFSLLSLEEAVHLLTGKQADLLRLGKVGRLLPGYRANIVLFDPEQIDAVAPEFVEDVPGGGGRYIQRARGIDRVIVGGHTILKNGKPTGNQPGRVIRY